jgi:hypothetical protein
MSSSGPYQSQLLNMVVRQTRRLRDESNRRLRQLRTTVVWGTQILLYPIYVLFQSSRLIERQFSRTARQVFPKLNAVRNTFRRFIRTSHPSPARIADTPIRKTLQAVQSLQLPVTVDLYGAIANAQRPQNSKSPTDAIDPVSTPPLTPNTQHSIHAIATDLSTRSLVLVTTQNEILDILTREQQAYIQRRLIGELATYLRYQKQLYPEHQPLPFLPPPARRPTQLLPVRAFRQLMEWMQRGTIARTANLFKEAALADYLLERDGAIVNAQPSHSPSMSFPSRNVAFLASSATPSDERTSISPPSVLKPALPNLFKLFGQSRPTPIADPAEDRAIASIAQSTMTQPETSVVQSDRGILVATTTDSSHVPIHSASAPSPLIVGQSSELNSAISTVESASQILNAEPHSTTIDTQVTLVEYVKHPLEQLLEWIDRGVLWLEQRIARLLTWLRQR